MKGKRKLLIPKVGPHFGRLSLLSGCGLGLGPGRILLDRLLLGMVSSKSTFFITRFFLFEFCYIKKKKKTYVLYLQGRKKI